MGERGPIGLFLEPHYPTRMTSILVGPVHRVEPEAHLLCASVVVVGEVP